MRYKTTIQLILVGLLIMCFSRCQTAKQLIDKAERKDPAAVASYTRDKFPCTEVLHPDTAVLYRDSVIYVDCPDTATIVPYETVVTDTINKVVTKTVRVPVTVRLPGTTITRWFEDSAKIFLLHRDIQRLQADTATLGASRDKWQGKAERRGKENWIWRAIALALIVYTLFRFWNKLTTIKIR